MDDDIMLNIEVRKQGKQRPQPEISQRSNKKMSKTDIKKMKYSNKLKQKTKMSRDKSTSTQKRFGRALFGNSQNVNTLTQPNKLIQTQHQTQQTRKKILNQQKSLSKTKKTVRKVKTQQSYVKKQDYRNENNKNRVNKKYVGKSQMQIKGDFRPELRKDVKVSQLLPQKTIQNYQIDTNDLDGFNLQPKLKDSLIKSGVNKMTDIQVKSYPSLVNKVDSVIKASTGSGKTLAYLVPLLNRIIKQKTITAREDGTCIIVVCPTRELCVQGQKQAGRCLKRCPFIIAGSLYGGQDTNHQKSRLRKGTNVLFCTPGRVLYHLQQTKSFKLNNLQAIVFQQADRTLDMGFQQSVHKIINVLKNKMVMSDLHKILVSAHFNSKVSSLLEQIQMNNPKFIGFQNVDPNMSLSKLKESKDIEINTSSQLKQQYVLMSQQQKIPLMLAYLGVLKQCKVLIFMSTIDQVQFMDYLLNNLKFRDSNGNDTTTRFETRPVFKIHGDLDQKLRSKTYLQFRQSKQAILISTQVASRGLDFPDLSHIILFDVPPTITDYGNRVGRSARFNQAGVSLLMLHYIQSDYAQKIRYYAPNLQVLQKDIIYESFAKILKSMNIGDASLHYIQGLVRASVKNDQQKYMVARKAYVSMLRAYARLPERQIFAVKKLNLKLLARSFGLNNAQADNNYNPKAKSSHLQASRKKRRVQDVKKIQVSQYL